MTCCNACIFCFMTMLPKGMRPSLYERDDDYRLSFLQGNFVTLTNMSEEDVQRVIDMHLSPLHVSLHAITPEVRKRLMGKNHARGVEVLEQLLAEGIEVHAQLVLLPGINDGAELDATLAWIEQRPNILSVGIVPYGYTKYAHIQGSFTAEQAQAVIAQLAPYQERSRASSGTTRFQLADEWYLLADAPLPADEFYDDYPQYEDGIGMLRSFIDETTHWDPVPVCCFVIATGEAFAPVLQDTLLLSSTQVIAIKNNFFGGNVNVAGLLTATDVIEQLAGRVLPAESAVLLPPGMFNVDGLTLDDCTVEDIARALKRQVLVVPLTLDCILEVLETRGASDCCSGGPA
jgi:putative radical SAM enzyme (TIGR03279 family)